MHSEDKSFSPHESLQLIQSMIDKTKVDISENSFNFLLWGWLAFLAILGQYTLKVVFDYKHHYIVWLITFVGIGISIAYNRKSHHQVRTYISESMAFLWIGLGISFFILSFLFANIEGGWFFCYPFFILLYGLGTFVSGMILKFRPLIIGGIFNWLLSMASVFFDFDNQMLFAAAALLTSYIIPGHLLGVKKYHHKK
jgi:hypothetical protein